MNPTGDTNTSKVYPIALEVAGPLGMFPDYATGSDSKSLSFPPPSACKGIIENVVRIPEVEINIVAIGICFKPQWTSYAYNTYSHLRKPDLIPQNSPWQMRESALVSPCYQILATLRNPPIRNNVPERHLRTNAAHSMQQQFFRRLLRGKSYVTPALGRKEFLVDYFGPFRTKLNHKLNYVIESIQTQFFGKNGIELLYQQNVPVEDGVIHFDRETPIAPNGFLAFADPTLQSDIMRLQC